MSKIFLERNSDFMSMLQEALGYEIKVVDSIPELNGFKDYSLKVHYNLPENEDILTSDAIDMQFMVNEIAQEITGTERKLERVFRIESYRDKNIPYQVNFRIIGHYKKNIHDYYDKNMAICLNAIYDYAASLNEEYDDTYERAYELIGFLGGLLGSAIFETFVPSDDTVNDSVNKRSKEVIDNLKGIKGIKSIKSTIDITKKH